jgi:hypothetical protein
MGDAGFEKSRGGICLIYVGWIEVSRNPSVKVNIGLRDCFRKPGALANTQFVKCFPDHSISSLEELVVRRCLN